MSFLFHGNYLDYDEMISLEETIGGLHQDNQDKICSSQQIEDPLWGLTPRQKKSVLKLIDNYKRQNKRK